MSCRLRISKGGSGYSDTSEKEVKVMQEIALILIFVFLIIVCIKK